MVKLQRKLIDALNTHYTQWTTRPSGATNRRPAPTLTGSTSSLAEEFLAWARWLDTLRDTARDGDEATVRALAVGKLAFILRRCLLLREKTMLGGSAPSALATEAASLADELEQTIGELTGHIMPAVDEWPLPVRLYRQTEPAPVPPLPQRLHERRRDATRRNRLDTETRQDAQQACGSLQLVLTLLQQQGMQAESPLLHRARQRLEQAIKLGRLDLPP